MKISVVIPCYNSASTIERCVGSVVASAGGEREVILVDSGEDDSAQRIEARFPEVVVIRSRERLLPGAARNAGWRRSTGEVVAFLDSDCLAASDWLAQIERAHRDNDVACVTGALESAGDDDIFGFVVFCSELAGSLPGLPPGPSRLAPTGNSSYKRTILDQVGGFREDTWCEDTILAREVTARGWRIYFDPAVRVRHVNARGWQSFVNAFRRSGFYSGLARARFDLQGSVAARHPPLIPLLLPYRVLSVYRANVRGKNPGLGRLVRAFPLVASAMGIWTASFWRGVRSARSTR